MTDLLTLLAFNSLYIFGFWNSVDYSSKENVDGGIDYTEGEIFGRIGYYTRDMVWWL